MLVDVVSTPPASPSTFRTLAILLDNSANLDVGPQTTTNLNEGPQTIPFQIEAIDVENSSEPS